MAIIVGRWWHPCNHSIAMKFYRVKQEGIWFYPQYRCLATFFRWTNFQTSFTWWEFDVYFDNLAGAKKYITKETAPTQKEKEPEHQVIIHLYP